MKRRIFMKKILVCLMVACMLMPLWLSGCAPKVGGSDYSAGSVRSAQTVSFGTVQSVRAVRIENDQSVGTAVGTVGGAVIGGVLGSMIGGGRGRTLATMGGAVAGAGAGYLGGQALQSQTGLEITVRMDSGETIAVTQGADMSFSPGQRVQVMSGASGTRVVPL
jgi:outer membrane lipoprotein SlyB